MGTLGNHGGGGTPEKVCGLQRPPTCREGSRERELRKLAGEIGAGILGPEQWQEHGLGEQVPLTTCDPGLLNPFGFHSFISIG